MLRIFRQYVSIRRMFFILGEGLLIYLAVTLTAFFFLERHLSPMDLLESVWLKVLLVTLVTQFSLYFNDLYELKRSDTTLDLAARLIQSIGMTSVLLALIYFIWPATIIGRWIFLSSVLLILLFLASWRFLYNIIIKGKVLAEKVILLGSGELARDIIREIKLKKDISYDIRSVVVPKAEETSQMRMDGIPLRYGFDDLCGLVEADRAASIIVALDQKRGVMPYGELLNCKLKGLSVIDGETFYERISGKLLVDRIKPSWLIFSDGFVKSGILRLANRLVDLILSSIMLILFSPLILITAIAIKLDSTGPIFYAQKRVGENEKIFTLYKFRSMNCDAEAKTGPVWACEGDPRATRIGKIVRKLRIDELPQLWNVFKGNLSFVGPRPERPFFVEKLKKIVPYYKERFTVKPGVTGWAQIKYSYGASVEDAIEKLKYDLYYIKNMSLLMDFIIIFHTFKIVLLGRGSR